MSLKANAILPSSGSSAVNDCPIGSRELMLRSNCPALFKMTPADADGKIAKTAAAAANSETSDLLCILFSRPFEDDPQTRQRPQRRAVLLRTPSDWQGKSRNFARKKSVLPNELEQHPLPGRQPALLAFEGDELAGVRGDDLDFGDGLAELGLQDLVGVEVLVDAEHIARAVLMGEVAD